MTKENMWELIFNSYCAGFFDPDSKKIPKHFTEEESKDVKKRIKPQIVDELAFYSAILGQDNNHPGIKQAEEAKQEHIKLMLRNGKGNK